MNNNLLWQPSESTKTGSKMYEFLNRIAQKYKLPDREYATLHQWSVDNIGDFWSEIWDFCNIKASKKADTIIDDIHKMPGAIWFEGARLNFAENLLSRKDDHTALIFKGETSVHRELTYAELYEQVRRVAAAMKNRGVVKGDRIAAFMPNMPETVIGMLAASSIGAIWSSTSPDFGTKGVLD
ncbi:MAG: AMP-binding protein, partial [Maribacter sp.]|nr:AMP-binding protein [Maribacter sp.]